MAGELRNYGTWERRWYQLWLSHLEWFEKAWKKLEGLEIRGKIKTNQTTALLRSARILRRIQAKDKQGRKWDKYLDLAKEQENMKMTVIPIVIGALGIVTEGPGTENKGLGNKSTCGDHPKYSIVEIVQNMEKVTGGLRRLAVTWIPVKNHQLTLVRKTLTWTSPED